MFQHVAKTHEEYKPHCKTCDPRLFPDEIRCEICEFYEGDKIPSGYRKKGTVNEDWDKLQDELDYWM